MRRSILTLVAGLGAASAFAQSTGNPGFMAADTPGIEAGKPKPDYANPQDKLFVRQAALGGRAEVELGKLAQSKGQSEQVREFGKHMVEDHSRANDELMKLGRGVNAEAPAGLDPKDVAFRSELQREEGAAFDQRYLAKQIMDHQKTANLLQWQISNGQNQALKDYAIETLPGVMEHLRLAQLAMAELTGSAPPP